MRQKKLNVLRIVLLVTILSFYTNFHVKAASAEVLKGECYDLGEKDQYDLNKCTGVKEESRRFLINGDICEKSTKDGIVSYAVNSGNLRITINKQYAQNLYPKESDDLWHIVNDKSKVVDATKLGNSVGTGAIIVQTSKDGKSWITVKTVEDMYNNWDDINLNCSDMYEKPRDSFYETSNIQLANGCYYRILVAYKMSRKEKKKNENKECIEVYKFYAYDVNVDQKEKIDLSKAYQFSEVYRVDNTNGFDNPHKMKSDDPHIDWNLGRFYISGYTEVKKDGNTPIFLKVPGDRAALWFNLEQEIDKCNNDKDIKVDYMDSGSDREFDTPTIKDIGRGMLIIRKTDSNNKSERYIYVNYLEASATPGANTRVDLFEEGDYEVALDYTLHYNKPFVLGSKTVKTLSYRIRFDFKVRNGDISAFLRDIDTKEFISNGSVVKNGFYIDVAGSKYLSLYVKRELLTEGMDGLVEDIEFSGAAQEGRYYTDEGIYTVTVTNPVTGVSSEKRIYVGDSDIIKAHMNTGLPLAEIKGQIDAGATIDERGNIIYPVIVESESEEKNEDEVITIEEVSVEETSVMESEQETIEEVIENNELEKETKNNYIVVAIIILIIVSALVAGGGYMYKKKVFVGNDKGDGKE